MRIDLTCPIELWRLALPQRETHACELMFYNLSDKIVTSVEVTILLTDMDGEEAERIIHRVHDLDGRPAAAFAAVIPMEWQPNIREADITIEKVWFDDNSVWRHQRENTVSYQPNALPNSRSLEELRFVAGPTAVGFPEKKDGLWMCVCGRPNALNERLCRRCHRSKEEVFTRYTKEAIQKAVAQREAQLNLHARAAREDSSRLQLEREKAYAEKKRKRRKAWKAVFTVLLLCALAYGAWFHLLPYVRYRLAGDAVSRGHYDDAIKFYEKLGDYPGAAEGILECRYLAAKESFSSTRPDRLAEARDALLALGDYKDAAAQALEADYLRAGLLLDAGKTDEAAEVYDALGDYKDSATQRVECDYVAARALLDAENYDEAKAAFEALGDYSKAADFAKECVLRPAKKALSAADPDTAIALLETIPGYADADTMLQRAYYARGEALEADGKPAEAGDAFLAAGSYQDASGRASSCLMSAADAASAAGSLAAARNLYLKVPDQSSVTVKYRSVTYALAGNLLKDKEYDAAGALYAELPEDYLDALEMRQECIYRPALASLNAKEWQSAVDGFSQIPTYKDSADRLERARYGLAESLSRSGDYAGAIEQYEALGTYRDSEKQLKIARYSQAGALLESGDWAGAEALYEQLGTYKNSEDGLKQARYGKAAALYDAGDYTGARTLLAALGKYSDAEQRVRACDYMIAAQLEEDGQHEAAAKRYHSVSGYQDAEERAQAIYYSLGEAALGDGRTLQAGRYFTKAGSYSDAAGQAEACYDSYYGKAAETASVSRKAGNDAQTAAVLSLVDLDELPEKYAYLADWLTEANYSEGVRLFKAGKPFEALPYLQAVADYKNVKNSYLSQTCYLLLGRWENASEDRSDVFIFYPDGTCSLNGEKLVFSADTYTLKTGADEDSLTLAYRITSIDGKTAVMRDAANNNRIIRMKRTGDAELPATPAPAAVPEATAAPEDGATRTDMDFLVDDDENAD